MNKQLIVVLGATLVALTAVAGVYLSTYHGSTFTPPDGNGETVENVPPSENNGAGENYLSIAEPDPATDNITYTLPMGASPLRLSLPASIDNIFYSKKTGVGGFGLHAGGHFEGSRSCLD